MKRFFNDRKLKTIAVVVAFSMLISACSIDMNKIKKAAGNLSKKLERAFNEDDSTSGETEATAATETTVEETVAETLPVETEEVTPEATQEPTPTATPTPTETPTPTPTPEPERVDFSELTEDTLSGEITVLTEEFEEHYSISEDTRIADFSGNRMLLDSESGLTSVTAINLYLDGFYCEADGLYDRYINESLSEIGVLTGTIPEEYIEDDVDEDDEEVDEDIEEDVEEDETDEEETEFVVEEEFIYHVTIDYSYTLVNRILTVNMSYSVVRGDEVIAESSDMAMFDIYTGQYVNNEMLFTDFDAIIAEFQDEILDESENERARVTDIENLSFVLDMDDDDPIIRATANIGDEDIVVEIDVDDFEDLLTRYGRIVLF